MQFGQLGLSGRVLPHPDIGHVAVAVDCNLQEDGATATATQRDLLGWDAEADVVLRAPGLMPVADELCSSDPSEVIERELDLAPAFLFANDGDRLGDPALRGDGSILAGSFVDLEISGGELDCDRLA